MERTMGRSVNVRRVRGAKRATRAGAAQATRSTVAKHPARHPLLTRADVTRAVIELANTLAPADVGDLLVAESTIRERATQLPGLPGRRLRAQLELALLCFKDHAAGRCPQIPYYSISVLAAGVAYLADQLDFVPDFLPRLGMIELARDGLHRYCVWKGIAPALVRHAVRRTPAASRATKRQRPS
jgi:hypothetical protein